MVGNQPVMPYRAEDAFAAIADANRRKMVALLAEQPRTIAGLAAHFEMSPQGVAKHLKVLKRADIVIAEPRGRETLHRLNPQGLKPLAEWLAALDARWDKALARLRTLIEEN